ncbi:MAG: molecular chaperone TorD family protein [Campylobacterota bacterium]|nr:molecular chaperone TorD family protein [Campylobacterota bacterium]
MDNKIRAYIYAFLSRIFSSEIDAKLLEDMKDNAELLQTIGDEAYAYLASKDSETLLEELNVEYNYLLVMNNHPIESAVQDVKNEILVGLQNPVMQFYVNYGYDINLDASNLYVPDHIAIELGFMQKLVLQDDKQAQIKFAQAHLLSWIPPFLISVKEMSQNPFYYDLCDFAIEFLLEDYASLSQEFKEEV